MSEVEFEKYSTRGAYHWEQISKHPMKSNAFVKGRYEFCLDLLKDASSKSIKGESILDIGCGDGALTYLICKKGALAYGIDSSELAIQLARQKHHERGTNAKLSVQSAYDIKFDSNFFNGVVCSDVIEHVAEPERLLEEIKRLLLPDGVAVISTPIRITEHPLDKMHINEWFEEEFRELILETFPKSEFYRSHPVFWMELIQASRFSRIGINLLSLIHNPFFQNKRWQYFALQYAVCKV